MLSDLETHLEDLWTRRRLKDESGIDQIKTILASAIEKAKK